MKRSPACCALVLVLAFSLVALAAPAGAEASSGTPQVLHFTTPNPGTIEQDRYGFQVDAESDSGLPVVISVDPSTPACQLNPFGGFIYGNITTRGAGDCTVWADQPGDEQYAPAERISMTFSVDELDTFLAAIKASKGLIGITPTTFRADLEVEGYFGPSKASFPFPDQLITFSVAGKPVCSARTVRFAPDDAHFFGYARATCTAAIGVNNALKQKTYTAAYAGDDQFHASTATAALQ